jgi:CubicO group peptidase (beta-lactamase class C family)
MIPATVFQLNIVASHSCADVSLFNRIQSLQVSDTTDDDQRTKSRLPIKHYLQIRIQPQISEAMSVFSKYFCIKVSAAAFFLLLFQVSYSQYNFAKVDEWLNNNIEELRGRAVLMIYKDGKMIYTKAENKMSRRQKTIGKFIEKRKGVDLNLDDYTTTSRDRIASCSKWLSAALVMTFIDEGKLRLEDTVGKFLPVMTANGKGNITIWQCLSHTTAIKAAELRESLKEMKGISSMDDAINKIASLPMEGDPGKVFHYSNAGLQIAGAVIEKISGKDFETLFAERIAKPLGMKNTDFGHGKVSLPAGGAFSTPEDYMNFLMMILNEGEFNGKQILSKNSIIEMQKNRIGKDVNVAYSPAEASGWGYGFGEWIMDGAAEDVRSNAVSSPGLFGSFPAVNTKDNTAVFLFVFNLKNKGRGDKYKELQSLLSETLSKK